MSTPEEKDTLCLTCEKQTDCPILDLLENKLAYMAICSSYEKQVEPMTREEFFLRNGQ
jgi:hypothetical protein